MGLDDLSFKGLLALLGFTIFSLGGCLFSSKGGLLSKLYSPNLHFSWKYIPILAKNTLNIFYSIFHLFFLQEQNLHFFKGEVKALFW